MINVITMRKSLGETVESVKNASITNLVNNMVNSENISGTSMKDETLNDAVKILKGRIAMISKKLKDE